MKQHHIYQEILLNPFTSCFKKEWCEINPSNNKKISEKEKVLELIWNGMIMEILPEVSVLNKRNKPLKLWEVYETNNLIELNLARIPTSH